MNTAMRAPVRLISRLKNQSELTKIADFGGENSGGSDGVGRVVGWELLVPASR
jgi:hypothetical protein